MVKSENDEDHNVEVKGQDMGGGRKTYDPQVPQKALSGPDPDPDQDQDPDPELGDSDFDFRLGCLLHVFGFGPEWFTSFVWTKRCGEYLFYLKKTVD